MTIYFLQSDDASVSWPNYFVVFTVLAGIDFFGFGEPRRYDGLLHRGQCSIAVICAGIRLNWGTFVNLPVTALYSEVRHEIVSLPGVQARVACDIDDDGR